MTALIVGGDGLIGRALRGALPDAAWTSRRQGTAGIKFDLLDDPMTLPVARTVYLVAGIPGFMACETGPVSWLVNVDGVIATAGRFNTSFLVYISSNCVEGAGGTALARQKSHVEAYMRHRYAAIVRPARVTAETAPLFAKYISDIGAREARGVHRWSELRGV